jgi:phenylacetic acid degradation operon negative regulatory protein
MVAAKEVATDGNGRYRLTGHLAERQSRQSASRAGATTPYSGAWWMVVVTTAGSSAEVRVARRRALAFCRLAELREGVWMRPDNVPLQITPAQHGDVEVMTAHPSNPTELVARLWDLSAWSAHATSLLKAMAALPPNGPAALAPGFELSASVLRHLQGDPLLPAELLPADWPGQRLRSAYDQWDAEYRETLRTWSHEH